MSEAPKDPPQSAPTSEAVAAATVTSEAPASAPRSEVEASASSRDAPAASGRPPGALTPSDDPAAGKLPPGWLLPRFDYPAVQVFGYRWARATWIERGFWAIVLAGGVTCLFLAAFLLSPNPAGIGTHQQLGLPECGFIAMSGGYPCPSCGYTTTFTLAAHGRPIEALINQPFGFVVFCLTVLGVPLTALCVFRRVSLFAASERWPWFRIFLGLFLGWLGAWAYKCSIFLA